jgi:glycosyltransferase involved in cell wall biosynthesis
MSVRVAYLQGAPSGHSNACLQALADTGASLFVTVPPTLTDAPYDHTAIPDAEVFELSSFERDRRLEDALRAFQPDVVLIISWHQPAYRACARSMRRSLRVLCMDNQWLATPKQRLGVATRSVYIKPYFDVAFLPGNRQREFARRLGFSDDRIFDGFYSADTSLFMAGPEYEAEDRRAFVFVGRLAPEKGVDTLRSAYLQYRDRVDDPWGLIIAGTGPESGRLGEIEGVDMRGFVQPTDLPDVFAAGRFLLLPSTFEPWGVVVHEATSSGLGVICTSAVGAGEYLVDHGKNGQVVDADSVGELTSALEWAHGRSLNEINHMRSRSLELASKYSPERWADTVLEMAARFGAK